MAGNFIKNGDQNTESFTPEGRQELLKSYIRRLSEGEDLESVRKDFVAVFKDVDAMEIMEAEQALMNAGIPLKKVQKLCDIHSALFHGKTKEERIANAEKAVSESILKNAAPTGFVSPLKKRRKDVPSGDNRNMPGADPQKIHQMAAGAGKEGREKARAMMAQVQSDSGHPVQILVSENNKIGEAIEYAMKEVESAGVQAVPAIRKVHALSSHYAKKGDLLYPLLKTKYAVTGPSEVMWSVDGEIRTELGAVCRNAADTEEWKKRAKAVLTRAQEMIFKENNILFPICMQCFSQDEWVQIRREFDEYDPCLIDGYPVWKEEAVMKKAVQTSSEEEAGSGSNTAADAGSAAGEIRLGSGHFTLEQLEALLNTLPFEITFVDENNINSYFNDGAENKLFKRPHMALGREVFDCHPPRVQELVRSIVTDFREGRKDSVEIWHTIKGEPVLVKYMAVRGKNGRYLGTMELVQRMGFAKDHFMKS